MRIAALALVGAFALALVGCAPVEHPAPTPTPTVTAVFASDAAALEAAEMAYRKYLEVSDQVLADGGQNPGRIRAVATRDALTSSISDFAEVQSKGWRSKGTTVARTVTLEQRSEGPENAVSLYVCDDVSDVDFLDSTGASVVSPSRPNLSPVEVALDLKAGRLLVAKVEAWSGGGVC